MELKIKEMMNKRGITSAYLSDQIGVSKVAVSNIITGKSNPSLDTLVKISDVLHVTISELIGETKITNENNIICPHCGKKIKIEKGE